MRNRDKYAVIGKVGAFLLGLLIIILFFSSLIAFDPIFKAYFSAKKIDATAYFYSDLESIDEYIKGIE